MRILTIQTGVTAPTQHANLPTVRTCFPSVPVFEDRPCRRCLVGERRHRWQVSEGGRVVDCSEFPDPTRAFTLADGAAFTATTRDGGDLTLIDVYDMAGCPVASLAVHPDGPAIEWSTGDAGYRDRGEQWWNDLRDTAVKAVTA